MDDPGDAAANPAGFDNAVQSDIPRDILEQYADSSTEKHKKMVELIRQKLNFDSLKFQDLEDTVKAIGIDKCKLCTYCWDGKE